MADNVTLNSMSGGDSVAADDIGGVKYQRVKLVLGADGAADLDVDSGQQTMANSVPVAIASNQSAVPVSASSLPLPSGAATEATLSTLNGKVTACNTGAVTVSGALPAGTNNIGDVDVLSVPADPFGTNADAIVAAGATGSISAKLRRVTQGLEDLKSLIVLAAGENHVGAVGGNAVVIDVVPTLTVHANYVSGDYVGTSNSAMAFSNAARVNGGTGVIQSAVLVDYALQSVPCELWLFDTAPTPPADSAAWSISDADCARCIGVIPFTSYYASALNSVAVAPNVGLAFKCGAASTALYGCLVTRGAPTYASGDLTVRLMIAQD